jgi:hypothetical protein
MSRPGIGAWRIQAKRIAARVGLAAWLLGMLAIGSSLLARHALALPRPIADAALARSMATLREPGNVGRWMAVHVLYTECRCSRVLVEHLLSTRRPNNVVEKVLLVGRDADLEARLTAGGFHVVQVRPAELAERYHVAAVPLLIVTAPDESVRYVGGYTTRKQGPDPRDLEIIAGAREERPLASLPVLGCAVSDKLRAMLNPLGLP